MIENLDQDFGGKLEERHSVWRELGDGASVGVSGSRDVYVFAQ